MSVQVKDFPVLYAKGKNGELRSWEVRAVEDKIVISHGVVGGIKVHSQRTATPKNVGRSNETTGHQQATQEALALYTHKIERKYSLTPEGAGDIVPLPMLAKDFEKVKKFSYPVDVQPKLDGVRAIARWEGDKVVLISRGGKYWTATPHINSALESVLPKDAEFDGEIYLHGKPFQWITSRAKKAHPDSIELQYHVYDMPTVGVDDTLAWNERATNLYDSLHLLPHYHHLNGTLVLVDTFTRDSKDQVQELHDRFVMAGYEGAIIRLLDGVYEYGHRSSSLLKLKKFDDEDFTIIGARAGEGIEEDLVLWECKNDINDLTFVTRPKGTHEDRRLLLAEAAAHVGEYIKVKFFGRTDEGLPRFPIAEGIRPQEDMD